MKSNVSADVLNLKIEVLASILDKYSINRDYLYICNLEDLILVLVESKEFYRSYYIDYIKSGKEDMLINNIILPFLKSKLFTQ